MYRVLLALFLLGCREKPPAKDRCGDISDELIARATEAWSKEHNVALPPLTLRDTILATCRRERWTTDLEGQTRRQLETILPTHVGGTTPDAGTGALVESGPHPDYPTPLAAGTSNIFFLEEPVRVPPAPK